MDDHLMVRLADMLWRWRSVVAVGAVIAALCGLLAAFELRGASITERGKPLYESHAWLFVERADQPLFIRDGDASPPDTASLPSGRYTPAQLADIYPYIAESDGVESRIEVRHGELAEAEGVESFRRTGGPEDRTHGDFRSPIPVVDVSATATTPERAQGLARTTAELLITFVDRQQDAAGIAPPHRTHVSLLSDPEPGQRVGRGPVATAVGSGVAVFVGFVALVFLLDRQRQAARRSPARPRRAPAPAPGAGRTMGWAGQ